MARATDRWANEVHHALVVAVPDCEQWFVQPIVGLTVARPPEERTEGEYPSNFFNARGVASSKEILLFTLDLGTHHPKRSIGVCFFGRLFCCITCLCCFEFDGAFVIVGVIVGVLEDM